MKSVSVKNGIFLVVLIITVFYFYYNYNTLLLLKKISSGNLIIYFVIVLSSFYILSLQFRNLMTVFQVELKFNEYFGLTICNTMFSYYAPARSGLIFRAAYLKYKYNFLYSHYASLVTGSYLISFNTISATGFILSTFFYYFGDHTQINMIKIFSVLEAVVLFTTIIILVWIKQNKPVHKMSKLNELITKIKDGMYLFKNNRYIIGKIILFNIFFLLFLSLRLYWAFKSLEIDVNFFQLIEISALSSFSMVLSLTPGNIGIKEGIIAWSATLLNVALDQAVLIATIDRIMAVIVTFSLGLIYSKYLLSNVSISKKMI